MTRVIYIMGVGRSGSTFLDITLGNHPQVVSVGELRVLISRGWSQNWPCSCGQPVQGCPFWAAVFERWIDEQGPRAPERLVTLQRRFERLRSLPTFEVARHLGLDAFTEYRGLLGALYRAVAEIAGTEWVVDSSKYPLRALALASHSELEVRWLHAVRDCRAVAWSIERLVARKPEAPPQPDSAAAAVRQWLLVNAVCGGICRASGVPMLRVRYEDLVTDPQATLLAVGRHLGIDYRGLGESLAAGEPLTIGHLATGNRLRFQSNLHLRADFEWAHTMPQSLADWVWRRAGWLAQRYGYRAEDVLDGPEAYGR